MMPYKKMRGGYCIGALYVVQYIALSVRSNFTDTIFCVSNCYRTVFITTSCCFLLTSLIEYIILMHGLEDNDNHDFRTAKTYAA